MDFIIIHGVKKCTVDSCCLRGAASGSGTHTHSMRRHTQGRQVTRETRETKERSIQMGPKPAIGRLLGVPCAKKEEEQINIVLFVTEN